MGYLILLALGLVGVGVAEGTGGSVGNAPPLPPFHLFSQPAKKLPGDIGIVSFDTPTVQASPLAVRFMSSTGLFDQEGWQVSVVAPSADPALSMLPTGATFTAPVAAVAA